MARFLVRDFGKCLSFPHNGGYVSVTSTLALRPSVFSWLAWINPSDFDANDYQNNFISTENANTGYAFRVGGGKLNFMVGSGVGNPQAEGSAVDILSGVWSHVVGTYDGANIKLYINGALIATTASGSYSAALDNIRIGRSTLAARDYAGLIDEVMYFNTALSLAQIQSVYYTGRGYPAANLIGYWKFDEGSGTSAADSSGNSNTGTLTAGSGLPAWSTNIFMKPRSIMS